MRRSQRRPTLLQKTDSEVDALLFSGNQAVPPFAELVGELDFPRHTLLCHRRHYAVYGMDLACHLAFHIKAPEWLLDVDEMARCIIYIVRRTQIYFDDHLWNPLQTRARSRKSPFRRSCGK